MIHLGFGFLLTSIKVARQLLFSEFSRFNIL